MGRRGRPKRSSIYEPKPLHTSVRMSLRTKAEVDTLLTLTGLQMSQVLADAIHDYYIRKLQEKSERRRQLDGWK